MGKLEIPDTLTVSDEDELDPEHPYDPPKVKIVTVKFGMYDVAEYRLHASHVAGFFYYNDANGDQINYDTPEEFLAHKLRKLFDLLGES